MRSLSILILAVIIFAESAQDKSGHDKRAHRRRASSLQNHEAILDAVKKSGAGWKVRRGSWRNLEDVQKMLGVAEDHDEVLERAGGVLARDVYGGVEADAGGRIPANFDARTAWPACAANVGTIQDQSLCGSCWAVSSAAVFSNRLCIATEGRYNVSLSSVDLLSCCSNCGIGCTGGYPFMAFDFIRRYGIVSGGSYTDKKGCMPYVWPPCTSEAGKYAECRSRNFVPPTCTRSCANGKAYNSDKYYAVNPVSFQRNPEAMQKEIMANGPIVISAMEVYQDLLYYRSGIYRHTTGGYIGLHAVRLIGWGVENNVPYWLIANSWGTTWGEAGLFRILRGSNECNIEGTANAAQVYLR